MWCAAILLEVSAPEGCRAAKSHQRDELCARKRFLLKQEIEEMADKPKIEPHLDRLQNMFNIHYELGQAIESDTEDRLIPQTLEYILKNAKQSLKYLAIF